jgi:DNA (cytosine-5)-methyltransferase 1
MRLLSLFSGIGAFEKALENLGIPFDLVGYCEIDKYASKAYSLIHNVPEDMNLGDITKVDTAAIGNVDLITYGFPCQDISIAGKQKGFEDENGERTRSGLFFEALRIIEDTQPKFAICENVKALTSKKFKNEFSIVLQSLEEAGYNNYWQVLNAKDYGVPQNRERVFIVSIRKDIDKGFEFPKPMPLELRLKDVLEDEVDEKYYLSERAIQSFTAHKERNAANGNGFGWNPTDGDCVANCILARATGRPESNYIKQVGQMYPNSGNPQAGRVYDATGISPAMDTCAGGNRMPKIVEPNVLTPKRTDYGKAVRKQYEAGEIKESRHNMTKMVPRTDGVANTLTTVLKDNYVAEPIKVGNTSPSGKSQCNDVFDTDGVYPNICAGTHGNCNPSILVREATKQGYAEAVEGDSVNLQYPTSKTRRGRVDKQVCQTLTCNDGMGVVTAEPPKFEGGQCSV